jgi:hypothetical protein
VVSQKSWKKQVFVEDVAPEKGEYGGLLPRNATSS